LKHVIPHALKDRARARGVVTMALESYKERLTQYQPTLTWESEDHVRVEFEVLSRKLSATVTIDDENLSFESSLPLLLRPFEGKAIDVVEREVSKWLDKARAGEI
jgi:hypothetical protein